MPIPNRRPRIFVRAAAPWLANDPPKPRDPPMRTWTKFRSCLLAVLLPLAAAPAGVRAQDLRPAPADAGPAQTTPPAPSPTQAAAPAAAGAQAQSPVNTRPFGQELIVLPVDHLFGD